MMNRFQKTNRRNYGKVLLSVAVFLLILLLFLAGLSSVSRITSENEEESLKRAILQSSVHCYATEGFYPDSLEYLKEHYGVHYDTEKYVVFYEVTGSNLMPDVRIVSCSEKKGELP